MNHCVKYVTINRMCRSITIFQIPQSRQLTTSLHQNLLIVKPSVYYLKSGFVTKEQISLKHEQQRNNRSLKHIIQGTILLKHWIFTMIKLFISRGLQLMKLLQDLVRYHSLRRDRLTNAYLIFYNNCSNSCALFGQPLLPISRQTHKFINYAIRQGARAHNLLS